ncbi:MAG: fimbrillin family protein [Bacteroidales bacterium]|nr:fimbrillin family protein [Bacteroidales bacterium]
MKKTFLFMLTAVALLASCNSDDLFSADNIMVPEGGVVAEVCGYDATDATRAQFSSTLSDFTWVNGDQIGLHHLGTAAEQCSAFTILEGGKNKASFVNDYFSLKANTLYYAIFPYNRDSKVKSYPLDYVGQKQLTNGGTEHIGQRNYMAAEFTTDDNRSASFTFSNISAILRITFVAPKDATYKRVLVASDGTSIVREATYDMTTHEITPTRQSSVIALLLDNIEIKKGDTFTANLLMAPQNLSEAKLTITVEYTDGGTYEFTSAGYGMVAGKIYTIDGDMTGGIVPHFGCPDDNHPHAIDLGMPDGTLWSCCNLGAPYPIDLGLNLSWGQTYLVERSLTYWSDYEFMQEDKNDYRFINKYQIDDKQYDAIWYSADSTFIGDGKHHLEPEDDAATVNLGKGWSIPSIKQVDDLKNYAYWTIIPNYSNCGDRKFVVFKKKVSGKYSLSDPHIVFPLTSRAMGYSGGTDGTLFWTSDMIDPIHKPGKYMTSSAYASDGDYYSRTNRIQVRPVYTQQK